MVRFKNRYFLVEAVWEDGQIDSSLTVRAVLDAIRQSVSVNFGEHGLGCLYQPLQVKYMNPITNMMIVRSSRDHYRMTWAALTFCNKIGNRTVMLRVIHVGGTIRTCREQAIQHDAQVLNHFLADRKGFRDLGQKVHRELESLEG